MKSAKTDHVDIELRDEGILVFRWHDGIEVDLPAAREAVEAALTIVESPRPSLVMVDGVAHVTRDARVFFSDSDLNARASRAVALLVDTPVGRVLGNFFLGLNRPRFPTRLFSDEASAMAWLRDHL